MLPSNRGPPGVSFKRYSVLTTLCAKLAKLGSFCLPRQSDIAAPIVRVVIMSWTLPAAMREQLRFLVMYSAAATLESVAFTESRGRSGTCSPRAARGLSPTKVRLFLDPAPQPAALCAPVGTFGFETECTAWRWLVISLLVVACVLGARDACKQPRKEPVRPGGRSRCAQGRASAASRRQKTPSPRLGHAITQLRSMVILCLVSAASAVRLATNVACLPYEAEEVFLDFSGVRACHSSQKGFPSVDVVWACSVAQARPCCTTTWAGRAQGTMITQTRHRACQRRTCQGAWVR